MLHSAHPGLTVAEFKIDVFNLSINGIKWRKNRKKLGFCPNRVDRVLVSNLKMGKHVKKGLL